MSFIPMYDLESLNEQQRQDYVKAVCEHMGVPVNLNLVMLTYLDEQDGPRRLVAYAKRGATEIVRDTRGISVVNMTNDMRGGSIVFTVTGKDSKGRQEISVGSKWIEGLTGQALDDAVMTAQTRATRRMTLQFVGAGVLDESEVNPRLTVEIKNTTPIAVTPQPTIEPTIDAGKDITEDKPKTPEQLRAEAIAQLNDKVIENVRGAFLPTEPTAREEAIAQLNAEKPKRTRKRKDVVDMGPSTNPVTTTTQGVIAIAVPTQVVPAVPVQVVPAVPAPAPVQTAFPVVKPKLSPDVIKPFRQRQFKFITELELAGFAPKEGKGNLDKMRDYVGLVFPEVTNFNELSAEQWETYLTGIETRLKANGAQATIKFIEEAIGV